MEKKKLDKVIEAFRNHRNLKEEIANVVGTGNIAGTPEADPGNPPVFKNKKKKYIFQNGLRKWWKQNLR
ncbi:MAG: hypothetical protein ACO3EY_07170 [Candidatus Nanopelagicales bacterium]